MKTTVFAAATFILAATSAIAADAVSDIPAAPAAIENPAFSWTGFDAGVQVGYGWNKQDILGIAPAGTVNADFNTGMAGGFAGYNYQFSNNWVAGLEGDFEGNWGDGKLTVLAPDFYQYGFDWQGSVRAKVGYAVDRALVYGTAGWAIGRGYLTVPGAGTQKENFYGFTVGAGVDYAFTDMIFGRVEYRYTNFGDQNFDYDAGPLLNSDIDQHGVRLGLGVKF